MSEKEELLDSTDRSGDESRVSDKNGDGSSTPDEDIAGQGIGEGEIRAVAAPKKSGLGPLLLGVLLLVVLIGGGVYLINGQVVSRTPQLGPESQKRYSIEQVQEERVSEASVAAVEHPAEQKAAVDTVKEPVVAAAQADQQKPAVDKVAATESAKTMAASQVVATAPLYRVLVGPYLYVGDTKAAEDKLVALGYQLRKIDGSGPVSMVRLLVGRYPPAEARTRLAELKSLLDDAFLLPDDNRLAIYAGSFSDRSRAERYVKVLAEQGVSVTPVVNKIEMNGKMFVVAEAGQDQARALVKRLAAAGFSAHMTPVGR